MLRPQITESLPIHHVGPSGVEWDHVRGKDSFAVRSQDIHSLPQDRVHLMPFLQLADADARTEFGHNAELIHTVVAAGDGFMPQAFWSMLFREKTGKFNSGMNGRSAYHIDINKAGFTYLASSMVPTEHLAGRFLTVGSGGALRSLVTAGLIALQSHRALSIQPEPDEAVRIDARTGVHRSPARRVSAWERHALVRDIVTVA